MSIALMSEAWKMSIPTTEKMVLLCLCDFANDRGECWPSVDTLAGKCSLSDRTVQKAIKQLKAWGIINTHDVPGRSHKFTVVPRSSFTPENASPPKQVRPTPENASPTPEAASPKPSKNHQEPPKVKDADAPLTVSELVEDWNATAASLGLPKVTVMSERRTRQARAMLRRYPQVTLWQRAFATIRGSPFLRGQNDRGWKADFDFLLQDKSFTKLVEGSYGQA